MKEYNLDVAKLAVSKFKSQFDLDAEQIHKTLDKILDDTGFEFVAKGWFDASRGASDQPSRMGFAASTISEAVLKDNQLQVAVREYLLQRYKTGYAAFKETFEDEDPNSGSPDL